MTFCNRSFPAGVIALLSVAVLLAIARDSKAGSVRLVVVSPHKGAVIAGKVPIRMRLAIRGGSNVRSARFYVQGKRMDTDRKAPFRTRSHVRFDTRSLPVGPLALTVSARYTVRNPRGKLVSRTRSKRLSLTVLQPPTGQSPAGTVWVPALNDEFDSVETSTRNWNTQRRDWIHGGTPYSNLEVASYMTSNVAVANGNLVLRTNAAASSSAITTGSVNSRGRMEFLYGYVEARILVPSCDGCWPAFWMLSNIDRWPPEVDIVEMFDTDTTSQPFAAVHRAASNNAGEEYVSHPLDPDPDHDYTGAWHTYGAFWSADQIQIYIDGIAGPSFGNRAYIPHSAMYPILQLAVQKGHRPIGNNQMLVDYVRAWRFQ